MDRKIRLAREDAEKRLTETFACTLLKTTSDIDYVHEMTGLCISKIKELKESL